MGRTAGGGREWRVDKLEGVGVRPIIFIETAFVNGSVGLQIRIYTKKIVGAAWCSFLPWTPYPVSVSSCNPD